MDNKYIMIVGVLDSKGSTNIPMALSFMKRGFNIMPVNYRTIIKNKGMKYFESFLLTIVKEYKPELVLFSKTNGIAPYLLNACNEYSKTYYWFMDNIQVANAIGSRNFARVANYCSATSSEVVDFFRSVNDKATHIIEGYDNTTYFKEENDKLYDVVFFGSPTEKRVELLRQLDNVTIFGKDWPSDMNTKEMVIESDLRKVINQSKIILNFVHGNIFSDRILMTLGCGGFMLSEHCDDLTKFFKLGKHLCSFLTIEECSTAIEHFLKNDEERIEIGRLGMELAQKNYTWNSCIDSILNLAGMK